MTTWYFGKNQRYLKSENPYQTTEKIATIDNIILISIFDIMEDIIRYAAQSPLEE